MKRFPFHAKSFRLRMVKLPILGKWKTWTGTKTSAELEEERRMLYVAMTRARHELYIYAPKEISGKNKKISSFLND